MEKFFGLLNKVRGGSTREAPKNPKENRIKDIKFELLGHRNGSFTLSEEKVIALEEELRALGVYDWKSALGLDRPDKRGADHNARIHN